MRVLRWPTSGEAAGLVTFLGGLVAIRMKAMPFPVGTWEATAWLVAYCLLSLSIYRAMEKQSRGQDERTRILLREVVQGARRRRVPRVQGGANKLWLGSWELEALQPGGPPFGLLAGSGFSLRIAKDGRVLVSGDIYQPDGTIAASVYDSEFESVGQFASEYDCNADGDAFEIVDENTEPVLQIVRQGTEGLVVTAFWRLRDAIIGAERGQVRFDLLPHNWPRIRLPRIFQYPSTLYPGRRV